MVTFFTDNSYSRVKYASSKKKLETITVLLTFQAEPKWQMMEQFVLMDLQRVFGIDCLESSHPISIPVNHPDEINEIFDRISYSKGELHRICCNMQYFIQHIQNLVH